MQHMGKLSSLWMEKIEKKLIKKRKECHLNQDGDIGVKKKTMNYLQKETFF